MTRVLHTGDTHIGYQQYNSPERRRDFLRAFQQVGADAIESDVDAVVHAGDLFHDRRPGLADLQGTVAVLRTIADAGIPFLAVVGNHDSKRETQWLDFFADLGLATRLGSDPTVVGDVAFYGLDFVPRSRRDELTYEFEAADVPFTALVAHGLFEPFAHADWDTAAVLEAATVDFDALLLGDNHTPDTARVDETWVTYCGSTERASATEREPRGYNLVTFDEEVSITRRAVADTREFVFVDVELAEGEGIDRVRERVAQHHLDGAVVLVTIDGAGDAIAPATVEEFATERGALVVRANDRRTVDEEVSTSVTFADPDDAVRDRIRELGLSDVAQGLDRVVRDETVADSNVREVVERRIRDTLEDAAAFEPAVDPEPEDASADEESATGAPSGAAAVETMTSRVTSPAAAGDESGVDSTPTTADESDVDSTSTTADESGVDPSHQDERDETDRNSEPQEDGLNEANDDPDREESTESGQDTELADEPNESEGGQVSIGDFT